MGYVLTVSENGTSVKFEGPDGKVTDWFRDPTNKSRRGKHWFVWRIVWVSIMSRACMIARLMPSVITVHGVVWIGRVWACWVVL